MPSYLSVDDLSQGNTIIRAKLSYLQTLDPLLFDPSRAENILDVLNKSSYDGPEDFATLATLASPAFKEYANAVTTNSNQRLKLQSSIEEYVNAICVLFPANSNKNALSKKLLEMITAKITYPLTTQRLTAGAAKLTLTTKNKISDPSPVASNFDLSNMGFAQLTEAVAKTRPDIFQPTQTFEQHSISGQFINNLVKANTKLIIDINNRAKEANIKITPWWPLLGK